MDLQEQLQMLNRLYKESDRVYNDLASKLGMTTTAFWVFYAILHSEKPLTQNDLCSEFFFPAQTINSTVGKLLKEGLIELEVIPGTRNKKKIILTDKGRNLADETIGKTDEIEENAFLRFTNEERETYISLFKRHIEYLKNEVDSCPKRNNEK